MTITVRILGREVLTISTDSPAGEPDHDMSRDLSGGTTYSTPMGFTPSFGDQRWEEGLQP